MRKVNSFTVIELIIGLLISSVVITISFYAYFLFSSQLIKQQKKNNVVNDFQSFLRTFQNEYSSAYFVSDTLLNNQDITVESINFDSTKYVFSKEGVVRFSREKLDTFNFVAKIAKIKFLDDSLSLISEIHIEALLQKEKIVSVFTKRYSAQQIIQSVKNE